jgi:hypothetical protein
MTTEFSIDAERGAVTGWFYSRGLRDLYDFQTGSNEIKVLPEYETVKQKVTLSIDERPQNYRTWQSTKDIHLFRFLKWREGFLIPIFRSYDDLLSVERKICLRR